MSPSPGDERLSSCDPPLRLELPEGSLNAAETRRVEQRDTGGELLSQLVPRKRPLEQKAENEKLHAIIIYLIGTWPL